MFQVQNTHEHRKVLELTSIIVVINLAASTWSGTKKILPHELGINLPSNRIASTGKKNLIRREVIEEFEQIRSKAHYYLRSIGIKLLGGIVVPADRLQEVTQVMQEFKKQYEAKVTSFENEFQKNIDDILDEAGQEGWRNLIEDDCKALAADHLKGKFSFNWYALKIDPTALDNQSSTVSGILSIPEVVLEEVAKIARKTLQSYQNKDSINRKSLQSLETMKVRLAGLAVFNPKAGAIAGAIDEVLSLLPVQGVITGPDFRLQKRLIETIASSKEANRLAEERLEGLPGFIFEEHIPAQTKPDEAAAEPNQAASISTKWNEPDGEFFKRQAERRLHRDGQAPEVLPLLSKPAETAATGEADVDESYILSDAELDALFNTLPKAA